LKSLTPILAMFQITTLAFAGPVTFQREYIYQASEIDSKVSCRTIALEQVKRLLLEELGIYLEAKTEVKNFQLTKDQITTLTAGIVSVQIIEEKWDGQKYYLKAKIVADPNEVAKAVNSLKDDYARAKELEEARKKSDEALKEVERLRTESASAKDGLKKQERYTIAIKRLSSISFFEKGKRLYFSWLIEKNERMLKGAIEAYGVALDLNPGYAEAHKRRGISYKQMAQSGRRYSDEDKLTLQQAINDFKSAIELDPTDPESYIQKGWTHYYLAEYEEERGRFDKVARANYKEQYNTAANDCATAIGLYPIDTYPGSSISNLLDRLKTSRGGEFVKIKEAIFLKDSYASMYNCQGSSDFKLGNYQKAIMSLTKFLEIEPDKWMRGPAYEKRGECYVKTGDYRKSILDFTMAIESESQEGTFFTIPLYLKRAEAYKALNDFERAIKDYDKVMQEDSKKGSIYVADAYYGRGGVHFKSGNLKQAISDFDKAIELFPGHYLIAYFERGLAYSKLGNQKRAIEDMETAACTGVEEAWEFLKSSGLWRGTLEEKLKICDRKVEEYRKKEGQRKVSEE